MHVLAGDPTYVATRLAYAFRVRLAQEIKNRHCPFPQQKRIDTARINAISRTMLLATRTSRADGRHDRQAAENVAWTTDGSGSGHLHDRIRMAAAGCRPWLPSRPGPAVSSVGKHKWIFKLLNIRIRY